MRVRKISHHTEVCTYMLITSRRQRERKAKAAMWEPSREPFGPSLSNLERFWSFVGEILDPSTSWTILGHVGAILGHLRAILGDFGALLEQLWSHLGSTCPILGLAWNSFWASLGLSCATRGHIEPSCNRLKPQS